jgi:hypothetical protein
MRKTWKAGLGLLVLVFALALAAPGAVSAQGNCNQCTPASYCEEMCQWEFFGEFYFDTCRNWTYPCVEYSAATTEKQAPFFLVESSATPGETPAPADNPALK